MSKKELPTVQEKAGNWIPWQQFIVTCKETKTGAYKGLPMVLKDQQGHKNRKSSFENETLESVSAQSLEDFSQLLETLLDVKKNSENTGVDFSGLSGSVYLKNYLILDRLFQILKGDKLLNS